MTTARRQDDEWQDAVGLGVAQEFAGLKVSFDGLDRASKHGPLELHGAPSAGGCTAPQAALPHCSPIGAARCAGTISPPSGSILRPEGQAETCAGSERCCLHSRGRREAQAYPSTPPADSAGSLSLTSLRAVEAAVPRQRFQVPGGVLRTRRSKPCARMAHPRKASNASWVALPQVGPGGRLCIGDGGRAGLPHDLALRPGIHPAGFAGRPEIASAATPDSSPSQRAQGCGRAKW